MPEPTAARGLTTRDAATLLRVSEDKIRSWIAQGELAAVNTAAAACGKPRWVLLPGAIDDFARRRAGGHAPKPQRKRRPAAEIDFYPD